MKLNPAQEKAANKLEGNLLIVASAGTGKTTTIVERYKNLIESFAALPDEIMMTTFTNRAAKDMIEKIERRNCPVSPYIGTMHSLFLKILRRHSDLVFKGRMFTIITDSTEQRKIVKEILKKEDLPITYDAVSYFLRWIGKFKNRGILAENLSWEGGIDEAKKNGQIPELLDDELIYVDSSWRKKVNLIYKKYQEYLYQNKLMDFDEILILMYKLLNENPDILNYYRKKFHSIMVDEAQDLNVIQVQILELLKDNNLCLIGDDCQNIYEWRGSSNDLIFKFQENEENVFLIDNYRSRKDIISAVNKVIDSMDNKIDKKLKPTRDFGQNIEFKMFDFGNEEINWIVSQIDDLIMSGEKLDDIAILFRTNMIGKSLEREFRRREIPCHLSKGADFFSREEVKDCLSFLKLLTNPFSKLDFERVSSLIRGFGKAKIDKVQKFVFENNVSYIEALKELYIDSIEGVGSLIQSFKAEDPFGDFLDNFGYSEYLSNKYENERRKLEDKFDNIDVLMDLYKKRDGNVSMFLDALLDIDKKEKTNNKVTLSTIHGAKGLEWKHVFLASCNEKTLPFYKDDLTKAKRDSELRLFYVAISRAKDTLSISCSRRNGYKFERPSQFIDILTEDLHPGFSNW